ncbi:MAG: hypothetical protein Ta2F_13050 [Termitinemataceae bacterium]|nr:MAG: hypothetical protein Ta2F_13050 [Termitinemataceae bacterium]
MKYIKFIFFTAAIVCLVFLGLSLGSCKNHVIYDQYTFMMPQLKECSPDEADVSGDAYLAMFGPPLWHIEWVDPDGSVQYAQTYASSFTAEIMQDWPNPIFAYPVWGGKNIVKGLIRPAGAIFPFDSHAGKIYLSWQGGVDANFYKCLDNTNNEKRQGYKFDWKSFRELFTNHVLSDEICRDPWLADWAAIAEKTAVSGFDKRRIVPKKNSSANVILPHDGPFFGTSPFMHKIDLQEGNVMTSNFIRQTETFFAADGILHVSGNVVFWNPY